MSYAQLSKANTFGRVNVSRLSKEIIARKLKCEIPGCTYDAESLLFGGIPALACAMHYQMWLADKKRIEMTLVAFIRGHVDIANNAAWEESKDEIVISYSKYADAPLEEALRILRTPGPIRIRNIVFDDEPLGSVDPVNPPVGILGEPGSPIVLDPLAFAQ